VNVSGDFDPGDGSPMRHSGLMLVLSASDGGLVGVLADNGYLTELRTGAAGAVAADLLALPPRRARLECSRDSTRRGTGKPNPVG
jgi:ornithine cyclodeaminase/alanine dehydrogenase-like protein (mu-crystallin family)